MDVGTLVSGEADVADLPRFFRAEHSFHTAACTKNLVGIVNADYFVELQQVEVVGLQTAKGLFDLLRGRFFGVAVDFGHQEGLVAITIEQRFAHAYFTLAIIVVPAVIEEINSAIERGTDDTNAFLLGRLPAHMPTTEADARNLLAGAAQGAIRNSVGSAGG